LLADSDRFSDLKGIVMNINSSLLRRLHRSLAPIMLLPILLTLITGSLYQIMQLTDHNRGFGWLLSWHKGNFGILNLEAIYPFLNAAGLLTLAITGISMWFRQRRRSKPRPEDA
jgi:uncharacterized iron-regulated membrane protein